MNIMGKNKTKIGNGEMMSRWVCGRLQLRFFNGHIHHINIKDDSLYETPNHRTLLKHENYVRDKHIIAQ